MECLREALGRLYDIQTRVDGMSLTLDELRGSGEDQLGALTAEIAFAFEEAMFVRDQESVYNWPICVIISSLERLLNVGNSTGLAA